MKVSAQLNAREIADLCARWNWTWSVGPSILTIQKRFTPGDMDGLRECDMEYGSILGALPRTSAGSDWGTDCGGIGALSALKSGVFRMQRSGGSKQVLKALAKLQPAAASR